jgi:hypothetical protein
MPLQETMKMKSPVSSSSSSSFIRPLSKLKELGIYFIDDMESLPEVGLQNLSSLGQLSESQGMIPYLPSLQFLRIDGCSEEVSGRTGGWERRASRNGLSLNIL